MNLVLAMKEIWMKMRVQKIEILRLSVMRKQKFVNDEENTSENEKKTMVSSNEIQDEANVETAAML